MEGQQLNEINQTIAELTAQIKALKVEASALPAGDARIAENALKVAELTRQRGRAYSRRYIMDEGRRIKMNEKAKAYYVKNKERILQANKIKYVPKPKGSGRQKNKPDELRASGAYPSPPDERDLVYDDIAKKLEAIDLSK
jgi:hypothetical protein